jgi:hypothetical protein
MLNLKKLLSINSLLEKNETNNTIQNKHTKFFDYLYSLVLNHSQAALLQRKILTVNFKTATTACFNLVVESIKKNNVNLCIGFLGLIGLVGLYFVSNSFNELVILFGRDKVMGLVFFNVFLLFFVIVFLYINIYKENFFVMNQDTRDDTVIMVNRLILLCMTVFFGILLYYLTTMFLQDFCSQVTKNPETYHEYKFIYCCDKQLGGTFIDYNTMTNTSVNYKFNNPHNCSVVPLQQAVEPHGTFNLHNFIKQCIYSEVPTDPQIIKFKAQLATLRHDQTVLLAQGKARMVMDTMQALATNTAVEQVEALSHNTVVEEQAPVSCTTDQPSSAAAVPVASELIPQPATDQDIVNDFRDKLASIRRIQANGLNFESYLAEQKLAAVNGKLKPVEYKRFMAFCEDLGKLSTFEEKTQRYQLELKFLHRLGQLLEEELRYEVPDVEARKKK